MQRQADHVLIHGDFLPSGRERVLRALTRIGVILLGLCIVASMVIYGVKVHYEDAINRLARDTRDLNEQNKELQVKLNHIRSFKNVEAAAFKVPQLRMPPTVLNIPASGQAKLPDMPHTTREFPHVYGY
jgi:hypothetical protein